jgi:hypothetical protein
MESFECRAIDQDRGFGNIYCVLVYSRLKCARLRHASRHANHRALSFIGPSGTANKPQHSDGVRSFRQDDVVGADRAGLFAERVLGDDDPSPDPHELGELFRQFRAEVETLKRP